MKRAVIIGAQRTGGTLLSIFLSNHPDIFCARGEPLSGKSHWYGLVHDRNKILDLIFGQPFYKVKMLKLIYDQALRDDMCDYMHKNNVSVIHLTRNVLQVVTSTLLSKDAMKKGGKRHIFNGEAASEDTICPSPKTVVSRISHYMKRRALYEKKFVGIRQLHVTYDEITGVPDAKYIHPRAGHSICKFLGIPYALMYSHSKRLHPKQIMEYYENWGDVRMAIMKRFPELLDGAQ